MSKRAKMRPLAAALGLVLLISAAPAAAQEVREPQSPAPARNAVYVELLGNGLLYSMNYEHFFQDDLAGRVGLMLIAGGGGAAVGVPVMANFLFGDGSHHFEAGIGLHIGAGVDLDADVDIGPSGPDGQTGDDTYGGLYGTGTLGYRYQEPDGGLVFRAGLTPFFRFDAFIPWFGISIGYAF